MKVSAIGKIVGMLVVVFVLASCGVIKQPIVNTFPLPSSKEVVWILDKNYVQNLKKMPISFQNTYRKFYPYGSSIANIFGTKWQIQNGLLIVSSHRGKYYPKTGSIDESYVKYYISFSREENENILKIIFKPIKKETQQGFEIAFGTPYSIPKFSEEDLYSYLRKGTISLKYEINTPYPPESVYANFKRLLERLELREGYKDPVTGKIFKEGFYLHNQKTKIFVEVYPYKQGSKAIIYVYTSVSDKDDGNEDYVVETPVVIQKIKSELEKIVFD